jgi:hypothetical protein
MTNKMLCFVVAHACYRFHVLRLATFVHGITCAFCPLALPSRDFVYCLRLHVISFTGISFVRFCLLASPSCDFVYWCRHHAISFTGVASCDFVYWRRLRAISFLNY